MSISVHSMRMESPLNQRLRWSPPDVVYTPIDVTSVTFHQEPLSEVSGDCRQGIAPAYLRPRVPRLGVAL